MGKHIEIVVHRGMNRRAPENTMAAARLCVEYGLDYVEVDVRTSRDGVFYILHDPTVDRTTNGHGALAGMTSDEIDQLDAGSWFSEAYAGERIPRLESLLRWAKGRIKVYLDVKQAHPAHLIDLLYATGMTQDCFMFCEQHELEETLRVLDREIILMAHYRDASDLYEARERFGAQIVEIDGRYLSPALVAEAHEHGHRVMIFVQEDDPAVFRRIMACDVDLVNLDYAESWLRVLAEEVTA